ncbi:SpoIIE family protein phosphatase [Bacillus coahuilensis]|uniref:SpoIIE family protein phosphatase n=1 Tax=Bacillus coahuilensis TaxID=408580 RepID=UPI001389D2FB|nr:SpoIIE family protein phosphatase [Bacillus coahuilensis]
MYRPREQTFREISTDGPILGLLPHTVYEADKMTVEKGDIIVFYTDGIIERRKNTSDSNSIIKSSLSTIDLTVSAQEITEALYEKIKEYHPFAIEDDQTLIVLKV